jgi:hypothetical protein
VSIIRIKNVPLIPQRSDGTCWYASLRMLAEWRKATKGGMGEMIDPQEHTDCKNMADRNAGWPPENVGLLASWVKAKPRTDIKLDLKSLATALTASGPIWAGGLKTWGTAPHNHVVVIFGVADTGVLVNDPEPVGIGREDWKTWDSFGKFIKDGSCDVSFLTCP